MKIAYVAADITVGAGEGGSTHVTEVLERLRADNEVLALAKHGSEGADVGTVRFWDIPGLRRLCPVPGFLQAYRRVAAFGPDLIYERASSFGLGALLSYALGVPLVVEVNDMKSSRLSFARASRIITTSGVLVPDRYHGKTEVVTWGADTDLFNPGNTCAVADEYGLDGKTVVGYVGGFYEWHGLEEIVGAAEELDRDDVVFMLVGDGRIHGRITDMIDEKGLDDRFVLPGRVPHDAVPGYVACFDVALAPFNPARHRTLKKTGIFYTPLKIFEYMAAGKPVVTTRSGNLERLFTDGEDAVLVEPGDVEGLAEAVRVLLDDGELREQIGRTARDRSVKNYSWDDHVGHLEAVFEEITDAER